MITSNVNGKHEISSFQNNKVIDMNDVLIIEYVWKFKLLPYIPNYIFQVIYDISIVKYTWKVKLLSSERLMNIVM